MGEKSGRLGETLNRVGVFIDKNLVYAMKKLSSRLDPLLTMGLGGMVLFIALSIYLPMFDMIASAAG
jgi:type II secretory pathway component PulF